MRKTTKQAIPVQPALQPQTEDTGFWQLVQQAGEMIGVQVPSGWRLLAGVVISFAAGIGVGWVASWVIAALLASTASAFLAVIVTVVGWIVAAYLAYVVGKFVGHTVMYGEVENRVTSTKEKFMGWLHNATAPTKAAA